MHIDLNLLTALEALLHEGSVSRAAARLHLSQPAMSRTLARIREATGDSVLVRTGRGMVPSPRALALRAEVSELVRRGRAVLSSEAALEPAQLERTFTVRCHDAILAGIGPPLVSWLQRRAPLVTVRFIAEDSGFAELSTPAGVDLDIGATPGDGTTMQSEEVAHDRLAVALRKDHPAARGRWSVQRYADAMHVVVSRRGHLRDPIDEALATLGLRRRVLTTTPTMVAALQLAHECNLMVAVAERVCGPTVRAVGLAMRPLPVPSEPVPIIQSWRAYLDDDRGHKWFRSVTRGVIAGLMAARR